LEAIVASSRSFASLHPVIMTIASKIQVPFIVVRVYPFSPELMVPVCES
jgi:hypothetical protein